MNEQFVKAWLGEVLDREYGVEDIDDKEELCEIVEDADTSEIEYVINRAIEDVDRNKKVIKETLLGGQTTIEIPAEEILQSVDTSAILRAALSNKSLYGSATLIDLGNDKIGVTAGLNQEQLSAYGINTPLSDSLENRELLWNQAYNIFTPELDWLLELDRTKVSEYEGRFIDNKFEISESAVRNMAMIDANNSLAVHLEVRSNVLLDEFLYSLGEFPSDNGVHPFSSMVRRGLREYPLNSKEDLFFFYYNSLSLDSRKTGVKPMFQQYTGSINVREGDTATYKQGMEYAETLLSNVKTFSSDEGTNQEKNYILRSLATKALGVKDHSQGELLLTGGLVPTGRDTSERDYRQDFARTMREIESAKATNGQYSLLADILKGEGRNAYQHSNLINLLQYAPEEFRIVEYTNSEEATEWYIDTFIREYQTAVAKFLLHSMSNILIENTTAVDGVEGFLDTFDKQLNTFLTANPKNIDELQDLVGNILNAYDFNVAKVIRFVAEDGYDVKKVILSYHKGVFRDDTVSTGRVESMYTNYRHFDAEDFTPYGQSLFKATKFINRDSDEREDSIGANLNISISSPFTSGWKWKENSPISTLLNYSDIYHSGSGDRNFNLETAMLGVKLGGFDLMPASLEDLSIHEGKWKQVFSQRTFSQQLSRMIEIIRANIKSNNLSITTRKVMADIMNYDLNSKYVNTSLTKDILNQLESLFDGHIVSDIYKELAQFITLRAREENQFFAKEKYVKNLITKKSVWVDTMAEISHELDKESVNHIIKAGSFFVTVDPYEIITSSLNYSNWSSCHISSFANSPISLLTNEVTFLVYQESPTNPVMSVGGKRVSNKVRRMYGHLLVSQDGEVAIALEHFYPSIGLGKAIQAFLLEKLAHMANKESTKLVETDLPFLTGSPTANAYASSLYNSGYDDNIITLPGYMDYFLGSGVKTIASETLVRRAKEELLRFSIYSAEDRVFKDVSRSDVDILIDTDSNFFLPDSASSYLEEATRLFLEKVFFNEDDLGRDAFLQDPLIAPIQIPDFLTGSYYEDFYYYLEDESSMYYGAFFETEDC